MKLFSLHSVPLWQSQIPDFYNDKEVYLDTVLQYDDCNPKLKTLYEKKELNHLYQYINDLSYKVASDLNLNDVDIFIGDSWVNVQKEKSYISEHVHKQTLSGVIYLKCSSKSGSLIIKNPLLDPTWKGLEFCDKKNAYNSNCIKISPEEGQIYMWLSNLPHNVEVNNDDEERVSISFEVLIVPK